MEAEHKTSDPILRLKEYPGDYPEDVVNVLNAMSFGKELKLLGSMSLRSQLYAGDYDGFEMVNLKEKSDTTALNNLCRRFQAMMKEIKAIPMTWIGDIKAGTVEEWRVIPRDAMYVDGKLRNYNSTASKKKVDELLRAKVITTDEANDAKELLVNSPSVEQFLLAKQKIKFNVVRWTPAEVLANRKVLRDKSVMTLQQAFSSPTITKLDVISLVQNNRFTDFSVIYEFYNNGKLLNPDKIDIVNSLKENISAYKSQGNYFKAIKRQFALAKYQNDIKTVNRLTPILNSDLGRLYHVVGDIGTLLSLMEDHANVPIKMIRFEINQFKNRLANIYTLTDYLKDNNSIIGLINRIVSLPQSKIPQMLEKLGTALTDFLQKNAKPYLR